MIVVKEFPNKEFESKEELFKELIANKKELVAIKKSVTKNADAVSYGYVENISKNATSKAIASADLPNTLDVKVVINTTNFLDSHGDVHLHELLAMSRCTPIKISHFDLQSQLLYHVSYYNYFV